MTDLQLCCRRMHIREYVDIGNGLWLYKNYDRSFTILSEERLFLNGTLIGNEIASQVRRQCDLSEAPFPYPGDARDLYRSRCEKKHRLYLDSTEDYLILEHGDTGCVIYLNLASSLSNGSILRDTTRSRNVQLNPDITGAVWGRYADQRWTTAEFVPTAAFHLKHWSWFDPNNEAHDQPHFQQMLGCVAGLTKVRAMALFFRESMVLKAGPEMGDDIQEWVLFFPFGIERMSRVVTLVPGCFCAWSASQEILDQPQFHESWTTAVQILEERNPTQKFLQARENKELRMHERVIMPLYTVGRTADRLTCMPFAVGTYPDRPRDFNQDDANEFDRTMERLLLVTESEDRHGL